MTSSEQLFDRYDVEMAPYSVLIDNDVATATDHDWPQIIIPRQRSTNYIVENEICNPKVIDLFSARNVDTVFQITQAASKRDLATRDDTLLSLADGLYANVPDRKRSPKFRQASKTAFFKDIFDVAHGLEHPLPQIQAETIRQYNKNYRRIAAFMAQKRLSKEDVRSIQTVLNESDFTNQSETVIAGLVNTAFYLEQLDFEYEDRIIVLSCELSSTLGGSDEMLDIVEDHLINGLLSGDDKKELHSKLRTEILTLRNAVQIAITHNYMIPAVNIVKLPAATSLPRSLLPLR